MQASRPPLGETQAQRAAQRTTPGFEKAAFLGVGISLVDHDDVIRFVTERATTRQKAVVNYANVHAMNLVRREARFAAALADSEVVFCDGYGLKAAAAMAGVPLVEAMTVPDWVDALFEACAQRGLALFFLGDEERVAGAFAAEVARRHPHLRIAGQHNGFFDLGGEDDRRVIEFINAAKPDVIVTAMGMPRQEIWAHANLPALDASVVIAAGALFRVYTGLARRPPAWLSRHCLEWAWRFAREPRRLFTRYIIGNPVFLARLVYAYWLKRLLDPVIAAGLFLLTPVVQTIRPLAQAVRAAHRDGEADSGSERNRRELGGTRVRAAGEGDAAPVDRAVGESLGPLR